MNQKRTFALLAALLMLALGLAACGGGGSSTAQTGAEGGATTAESGGPETSGGTRTEAAEGGAEKEAEVPTIEVKEGEPVGGIARLEYDQGETIRFKVTGDEGEEIHVHGYDLMKDIPEGGGTVEFEFPAEIEGIFEAELEGRGVKILELWVNPS